MQCPDICENLSAYIDGMLEQQAASLVEQHLKSCPECKMEYEDLLATVELVRELPEVEPPPGFRDDLRERLLVGIAGGEIQSTSKPAARRLFGKRWAGLVAAAAVIFLAVGVTALWYDNQGGLPFPGKNKFIEESQVAQNEADKQVDNIMALRASDGPDDLRMDFTPNVEDVPQAEQNREAPAAVSMQSPSNVTGDETEEPTDTGSYQQPEAEGDTGFSIMAAPGTEGEKPQQLVPALTKEEEAARDAAPAGLGGGPGQAVEYSVTLEVYDQREAIIQVRETVENYDGFIEPQQDKSDNFLLITVPFYNAQTLIDEIGRVGTITDQQTQQRDLTTEITQLEENINKLGAREMELLEQHVNHTNPEAIEKELAEVREQITGLQAELASLNKSMIMSKVELVLNKP